MPALTCAALLIPCASAQALFQHVVAPGESLTSIAAQDGLSVSALAAANGLSPAAQLISGSSIAIPPQGETVYGTSGSLASAGSSAGSSAGAASDDGAGSEAAEAGPAGGSYVVVPGDTLTAIAARAGLTVASLAAANGLDPAGILPVGMALHVTGVAGGAPTYVSQSLSSPASASTSTSTGTSSGGPYPTPERLTAGQVASAAATEGVSSSLADAIGWQESGFNNDLVSSTGAVGVMQVEPGTWNWIGHTLSGGVALSPNSAVDNVKGGSMLLHWLLNQTGGDPAMAAAGYYQGLDSVRRDGIYPSTEQYVQSVMALRRQFGGG